MIYVLIVIVLFAALAFVLSRERGGGETGEIGTQTVNSNATQIVQLAGQIKQAVDEMTYGGSRIDQLEYCLPSDACYSTGATQHMVFHPQGGGVTLPQLPSSAIAQVNSTPPPGWYLGSFNNVAWSPTPANDVILTAHQLSKAVCAQIDLLLTGSSTIPALSESIPSVLIDSSRGGGSNVDLDDTACAACDGKPALCVSDQGADEFSFYSVIEQQ